MIEEFLEGEEASFIVLCDGRNVLPLATSQDHKRLLDGDAGPNTGGMGAYSPAPVVTPNVHARVMHEIILPTIAGMARDGMPFTGFLYAGLMIDAEGQPRTVEFNARLGDPETQPILMRLKSDLFDVLMHATDGTLDQVELQWDRRVALGVVMAAHGYPLHAAQGRCHHRPAGPATEDAEGVPRRHRAAQAASCVTSGGRVLCVTALGESVKTAQQRAYEALARHPHSTARSTAPTSATVRSSDDGQLSTARLCATTCSACSSASSSAFEAEDGKAFLSDGWTREPGGALEGDGLSRLVEEGNVFERAGCNFSHVKGQDAAAVGHAAPARAGRRALRGDGRVAGDAPAQPVRADGAHERAHVRRAAGGPGTPVMLVRRRHGPDAVLRRRRRRGALPPQLPRRAGALRRRLYPRFKQWCDEYFFLKHRNEPRGIGGIFFDDFAELGFERSFAMMRAVGDAFVAGLPADRAAPPRHAATASASASSRLYRRGRYVEFNLVFDRGTLFGLQSGGRTESILMSMPPLVTVALRLAARARLAEARLYSDFLPAARLAAIDVEASHRPVRRQLRPGAQRAPGAGAAALRRAAARRTALGAGRRRLAEGARR